MKKDIVIRLVIIALVFVLIAIFAFVVSPVVGWIVAAILVVCFAVACFIILHKTNKSKTTRDKQFGHKVDEYLNLIAKYTDINLPKKDITKEVKKGFGGKFNNRYDCITYLNYRNEYAIRFNDDMSADEFNDVFETLLVDLGAPDLFGEWEGYIWRKRGYIITFGLVSLQYHYEVPMICVRHNISVLNNYIDYTKYTEIANAISKPLIARGVDSQKTSFYKITYFKQFGFSAYIQTANTMVSINYKGHQLSMVISPIVRDESNREVIKNQNRFSVKIDVANDSELMCKFEELLEETQEHHGLTKK